MKAFKIFFCMLLFMVSARFVSAGSPEINPAVQIKAREFGFNAGGRSILYRNSANVKPGEPNYCRQYRTREIAGFTLVGLGVAGVAVGSYLTYVGANAVARAVTDNVMNFPEQRPPVKKRDLVMTAVGASTAFIGLVFIPTGLAMGITGTVRYNKNCPRQRSFYLAPSTRGLGLACNF
jgi:hypothetical protein